VPVQFANTFFHLGLSFVFPASCLQVVRDTKPFIG
jgi:hypothetical protein